ncbi:sensor histidine kinase [Streptomyces ochraceiscleroticus]|uniref:histidine kinase n=1 Tax=Streptomyces ochraceiscleroticus TaxID=47761 RepID=A0ABW1MQ95_9ACTN|nr:nitrate- and nitrite sensing domain-containing protein [Streptomyces ochraceiscleroticus]
MRARFLCVLAVPVVALLVLWGSATVTALQDAAAARQAQRIEDEVRAPVYEVVRALQEERRAAVAYLTDPTQARKDTFGARTRETERATSRLRQGGRRTVAEAAGFPARTADRLTDLTTALDALPEQRRLTTERSLTWQQAYGPYTAAIASAFTLNGALSGPADGTRHVGEWGLVRELLAQEDAVLTAADLTGTLDKDRQRSFTGTVAARRLMERIATEDLPATLDAAWRTLATGRAHADVRAMEHAVSAAAPGRGAAQAAPGARWRPSYEHLRRGLHGIEKELAAEAARRPGPLVYGVSQSAAAAVGLGFVALVLSSAVALRIARGLIRELTALRDGALGITEALREAGAGRQADTPTAPETPPAEDEIAQVRAALDSVHRATLDAVVERAEPADGISGVCVNLARRSQILLHRQLALLDSMERRSQDPAELGDLFRLDHLTTLMRRHAESLLILSGAAAGRAWRSPVPLTDVVRAAASETEDFARIEVRRLPAGAIPGSAVAELTHLLAELIENAAQFSPPHTKVRVQGEQVGTGHVLEIEDRGLGMEEAARDEANRRMEQAGSPDPSDGDRLGLFVVSRLAARHGVRVVLRASPYGGTTAVVLLPNALVHEATPPLRSAPADPPRDAPLERVRAHLERRTGRALEPPADAAMTASPDGVAPPDDPDELPRRIRQRSLAVQLREPSPAAADTSPEAEPTLVPEETRTRMTAYRHGWVRGSTDGEP